MATQLNRRWFAVASAPGTGDISVGSAQSGYATLGASNDGQTFDGVVLVDGTSWEVRNGCVYTHGTTTLTRGTLEDSSTGSAITLGASTTVFLSSSAQAIRRYEASALNQVAGTDAATSMAVNTLYTVDASALTAARTYTLPATASVGDRVGIVITTGSSSYEIIVTAASGDTLNGVSGGTEWSRLFITGELIVARCIVANSTWIIEQDGRIAQLGEMSLTADCDGETANTTTLPTSATTPGTWTVGTSVGISSTSSTGRFTVRRGGKYAITSGMRAKDAPGSTAIVTTVILKNGTTVRSAAATCGSGVTTGAITETAEVASQGDYYQMAYATSAGGLGCRGSGGLTFLVVSEILR